MTPCGLALLSGSAIVTGLLKPFHALQEKAPLAAQVAGFLLRGRAGDLVDLGDTLVLIPTAGAGRAIRRELSKRGVLSPQLRLPLDALVPVGTPVASRLEREAAWALLLDPARRRDFAALVPEIVPLETADDRFGVAARLAAVCDQLAEAGHDPRASELTRLFEDDTLRWEAFGKLYAGYLPALGERGLRDPNEVRLEQAGDPSIAPHLKRVVVACIPDLPVIVQTYLQSLANKGIEVDVLAWSPSDQAAHLDAWGRPYDKTEGEAALVSWWASHLPAVADEKIVTGNDPASEAGMLLDRAAASVAEGYALFAASPESTVALAAEMARREAEAYLPEGRPLAQAECACILLGYEEFLRARDLRVLRSLLQRPSFLAWFVAQAGEERFGGDDALEACDLLLAENLCGTVDAARSWLEHADEPTEDRDLAKRARLRCLVRTASQVLQRPTKVRDLLAAVAQSSGLIAAGSLKARELSAMTESLDQFDQSPLLASLPADWQQAALRADIGRQRVFVPVQGHAVEIQGWLEAPWSHAGLKIIAGCREGALPSGVYEDAFLPDRSRKTLGIAGQEARLARDAYLLSCLLSSGSRVLLGTSRFRSQGEPNRPSRLLFACDDDELPKRTRRLLRPSLPAKRREVEASWVLHLPRRAKEGAVDSIRVTGFKSYLHCPLRFYLQNVCGLSDFDPEAREISARDFGTVMHKVLEEYGNHPDTRSLDDPEKIAAVFDAKLDEVARRFYGKEFSPVVLVQLESMRVRLRSFAPLQAAARAEGWEIIATEKAVKKTDPRPVKIGPLTLTGTMDRVEVNASRGLLRVLDYKTFSSARSPASTHLATKRDRQDVPLAGCTYQGKPLFWKDLQLPLYRYMVPTIWEEHRDKTIEVGYVLLPADPDDTAVEMLPLEESEFDSAVRCAGEVASAVAGGCFWPPADKADFDKFADWFRWCDPEEVVSAASKKFLGGAA